MSGAWKLSEAQRHEICRRFSGGESARIIASEFKVTPGHVYHIAYGRGHPRKGRKVAITLPKVTLPA